MGRLIISQQDSIYPIHWSHHFRESIKQLKYIYFRRTEGDWDKTKIKFFICKTEDNSQKDTKKRYNRDLIEESWKYFVKHYLLKEKEIEEEEIPSFYSTEKIKIGEKRRKRLLKEEQERKERKENED